MISLGQLVVCAVVARLADASISSSSPVLSAQSVNLWKLGKRGHDVLTSPKLVVQDSASQSPLSVKHAEFPVYTFEQPLDHFYNTTDETFGQRYWISTRHYKPGTGAPVIVIDGGETSGEDRLPFLDTGIADILAKATGGVGVVLEHRYYGDSISVKNLTTDSLRWLNNEQALEDSANFMRNVKFEGIDEDLTAPNTPWIYYGGSYAGARAAHMKVLYPDITWGAIAASAVTHAALTNWEYMDTIRVAADPICSANLVRSVATIDTLLNVPVVSAHVKGLFNLSDLASDQDFVSLLTAPLGAWQGKNWDPAVGSTAFDEFCAALNGETPTLADTALEVRIPALNNLAPVNGVKLQGFKVNIALLNYAKYIRENIVSTCPDTLTHEQCFGTNDDSLYQETSLDQTWRLWTYQYCTQWGYITTAPPEPHKYPPIISRLLDFEYQHKICRQAFPPGEHTIVPALPDIEVVNVLGDFDLAADRLAFIDGAIDPWRPDTPHSTYYAKDRPDTLLRPFMLIPGGVHHWDENGLADPSQEPSEIQRIHAEEVAFVKSWLEDFDLLRSP